MGRHRANPRRANGSRRSAIRRAIKAQGRPCAICGRPIDYDAPYFLPDGSVNPWAYVVDEVVPVSRGGDPLDISNCQPAHHICNARKGNRMPGDQGPAAPSAPLARSVDV